MLGGGVSPGAVTARRRLRPSAPAAQVPLNGRLVALGDSLTARAVITSGATTTYASQGWLRWFLLAVQHRVRVPAGAMLAVPGATLGQIADTMGMGTSNALLTARAPDIVTFMGGTNNLGSYSAAQLIAGVQPILAKMLASAAKLIVVMGCPRQKTGALTGAQNQNRIDYNAWLAGWVTANAARAVFVDCDAAGLSDADFPAGDSVHFVDSGARKLGEAAATAVAGRIAAGSIATGVAPAAIYTRNPRLTGNTSGRGTDWTADLSAAGGAGVSFAKEAGSDAQLVTIGGSYSGSARQIMLQNQPTVTTPFAAAPPGQEVEIVADVDVLAAPVGLNVIDAFFNNYSSAFQDVFTLRSDLPSYDATTVSAGAGKLILRSPAIVVPPSPAGHYLPTRLYVTLINAASATPVDIRLRINRVEARAA